MNSDLRRLIRLILAAALVVAQVLVVTAHAEALPDDAHIVNVKAYGAVGDGKADDTAAINAAILAAQVDQGKAVWLARIVYFPAGTYRVTDTLQKRDAQGRYLATMALVGESRDSTRIRLDDAAPGFNDARNPKAVIFTTSMLVGGATTAGGKNYTGKGEGNDAYGNYVESLTVDVGKNNPGAIGIDYLANNFGAMRDVRIVAAEGSGRVGVSMERKWPGPALLSNVRVEGFAVGIAVSEREYGMTMDGIELVGQSEVALRNSGNSLAMHDVSIETGAVAVQNLTPDGLIVSDHLTVALSRPEAAWIDNRGFVTIKGTKLSGGSSRKTGRGGLGAAEDGAYSNGLRLADFGPGWELEARAVPKINAVAVERWANVEKFGAHPDSGEDSSDAIRKAMQSGAQVIYFPAGRYEVADAVDVPRQVRRITGMFSSLQISGRRRDGFSPDKGLLRVASDGEALTIDRLSFDGANRGPQLAVAHSGSRPLVLRDVVAVGMGVVQRSAAGGLLFLENTSGGPVAVSGRNGVWSRQYNSEGGGVRVHNEDAPLWILGIKTEQNCTAVQNVGTAQTDVIGGLLYLVNPTNTPRPAFINAPSARLSAAYVESVNRDGATYQMHVAMPDDGVTSAFRSIVGRDDLPARARGRIVPGLTLFGGERSR